MLGRFLAPVIQLSVPDKFQLSTYCVLSVISNKFEAGSVLYVLQELEDLEELHRQQEEYRLQQEELERQRLEQERIAQEELDRKKVCTAESLK